MAMKTKFSTHSNLYNITERFRMKRMKEVLLALTYVKIEQKLCTCNKIVKHFLFFFHLKIQQNKTKLWLSHEK